MMKSSILIILFDYDWKELSTNSLAKLLVFWWDKFVFFSAHTHTHTHIHTITQSHAKWHTFTHTRKVAYILHLLCTHTLTHTDTHTHKYTHAHSNIHAHSHSHSHSHAHAHAQRNLTFVQPHGTCCHFISSSAGIRTLNLTITSRVSYHCATWAQHCHWVLERLVISGRLKVLFYRGLIRVSLAKFLGKRPQEPEAIFLVVCGPPMKELWAT